MEVIFCFAWLDLNSSVKKTGCRTVMGRVRKGQDKLQEGYLWKSLEFSFWTGLMQVVVFFFWIITAQRGEVSYWRFLKARFPRDCQYSCRSGYCTRKTISWGLGQGWNTVIPRAVSFSFYTRLWMRRRGTHLYEVNTGWLSHQCDNDSRM